MNSDACRQWYAREMLTELRNCIVRTSYANVSPFVSNPAFKVVIANYVSTVLPQHFPNLVVSVKGILPTQLPYLSTHSWMAEDVIVPMVLSMLVYYMTIYVLNSIVAEDVTKTLNQKKQTFSMEGFLVDVAFRATSRVVSIAYCTWNREGVYPEVESRVSETLNGWKDPATKILKGLGTVPMLMGKSIVSSHHHALA